MMFSKIRRKLHVTPSGVIAIIALVFALTGGAFAASSHGRGSPAKATASAGRAGTNTTVATAAKKKPKAKAPARGPVGPAGKNGTNGANGAPGATGPAGPAGPAGAKGENGTAGAAGTNGTDGTNGATGATGPPGPYVKTLPSKATETGTWNVSVGSGSNPVSGAISFTIPVAKALGATEVHYVNETGTEEVAFNKNTGFKQVPTGSCPGTIAEPAATPGNLCVYQRHAQGVKLDGEGFSEALILLPNQGVELLDQGATTSGALLFMIREGEEPVFAYGTWAVTAP